PAAGDSIATGPTLCDRARTRPREHEERLSSDSRVAYPDTRTASELVADTRHKYRARLPLAGRAGARPRSSQPSLCTDFRVGLRWPSTGRLLFRADLLAISILGVV